jgi:nucleoside-diphosphate-sugar epimerase
MKSILITGSNGYIARNINSSLKNCNVTLTNRDNLNLLCSSEVDNFFYNKYFDVVLHTAVAGGSRLVSDNQECFYKNCVMHFNLLKNSDNFGKYISFGSGAELDREKNIDETSNYLDRFPVDPYGMGKNFVARSGENVSKFYNIRIFNVFNEDELSSRMIKNNLLKYINNEKMIIHQDRYMDFMYFEDFMKIVNHYIHSENCKKSINCSYKDKFLLSDITRIINNLDSYKVEVEIENKNLGNSYIGRYDLDDYAFDLEGLESGIKKCYKYFLNQYL